MFLSLFQIPVGIDFSGLSDLPAGAAPPEGMMETMFQFGGIVMIIGAVVGLLMLAVMILNLINLFHWGMTDKAVFEKTGEKKKKWYINLIIIPVIAAVIGIVPILGWIAAIILWIYWIVMNLIYFFKIRKKITPAPASTQ